MQLIFDLGNCELGDVALCVVSENGSVIWQLFY